jgi:uncharacterized membrane protein
MVRRNADLVAMAVTTIACAAVVAAASNVYLRTPPAILLLLVLPGYAASTILFERVDPVIRLLLTVSLSIGVDVLAAIALDVTPWGLRVGSWAVVLGGLTLAAAAAGAVRRDRTLAVPGRGRLRGRLRGSPAFAIALALVILFDVVALVVFGRTPLRAKHVAGYTALWIQPTSTGTNTSVVVGVKSSELHTQQYRLEIVAGGQTLVRRLTLKPGEQAQRRFQIGSSPGRRAASIPTVTVFARLFRESDLGHVYRRVALRMAEGGG